MLFGALSVLITKQITFSEALKSINLDVILFLFGMFVIGQALEESGYLSYLSYKLLKKSKSINTLLFSLLFGFGILSAFLMNDTIAIIGTPVVLMLAKKHNVNFKMLLLALAFSITIGSVMSPIGNPQNLLIAINSNMTNPFLTFFKYLLLPTLINLFLTFLVLKLFYKEDFKRKIIHTEEKINDKELSYLSKISLILIAVLILIKIIIVSLKLPFNFELTYIALISMLPILLFSKKRFNVIKKIDWHTLIFFVAMFVLMQSVWNSGFFQEIITNISLNLLSIPLIFIISVVLSQFLSNVPLVALYSPLLINLGAGTKEMIALAIGSTIAGNLLILGAASNIIIIQNTEKKTNQTIKFLEFAKIGIPLTIINLIIYWMFLVLI
jgi:Na+/H+ antiporter NhaD/arsenite permease-like protein